MRKTLKIITERLRYYWTLLKSLQTALLLLTGVAGYFSSHSASMRLAEIIGLTGSLFLSISGSTVLNMWYDRDIDSKMPRTCWRPLPKGQVTPKEVFILGMLMSFSGVAWALAMDWLFGLLVFGGLFFDVIIYTVWLKRRSPWSVLWGGIAGGMPVLAGRALGIGSMDWIGVLLAASILFWIPTHYLTFSMRYFDDYKLASIPTFPAVYGFQPTRILIASSSILAAASMILASTGVGMTAGYFRLLLVLSCGLLILALSSLSKPTQEKNFGLFKYASLYMLSTMLLFMVGT